MSCLGNGEGGTRCEPWRDSGSAGGGTDGAGWAGGTATSGRVYPPNSGKTRCSAKHATIKRIMASVPPLSLRLGREGLSALEEIARRRGVSRAEAARQAITETAARERGRTGLAAEARNLMKDESYVREAREVASLMEELRGPG